MNTVVLLSRDTLLLKQLQSAFARSAPQLSTVLADDPLARNAQIAACWFPLPGSLAALPNLQVIHSVAPASITSITTRRARICRSVEWSIPATAKA